MEAAFFPLDEELGLVPGELTPLLHEWLVRLGVWMPFAFAAELLGEWSGVILSEATARRDTEEAGAAWVRLQTAEVEWLEREHPPEPAGPAVAQLSIDGAMVPVLGGEWVEVKTLAVGVVETRPGEGGQPEVHTTALSYFSRQAPAEEFTRLALGELHRRGVLTGGKVAGVCDGAVWQQGFLDYHRPDAVRVLDFPHAGEHVALAGKVVWGAGTAEVSEWLGTQLHELKHGDPEVVLAALRALPGEQVGRSGEAQEVVAGVVRYLEERREQIRYATFRAQGLPIGSGVVESANKLVVEVRLKGSGMHWARAHVNPLVALRTVVCSRRWGEVWPQIAEELRAVARRQAAERHAARQAARAADTPAVATTPVVKPAGTEEGAPPTKATAEALPTDGDSAPTAARVKTIVNGRPTAQHPWKRPWATARQTGPARPAKL